MENRLLPNTSKQSHNWKFFDKFSTSYPHQTPSTFCCASPHTKKNPHFPFCFGTSNSKSDYINACTTKCTDKKRLQKAITRHTTIESRKYTQTHKEEKQSEVIHRMRASINFNRYSSQHATHHNMYTRNRHSQRAPMLLLWALVMFAAELEIGKCFLCFFFFIFQIYIHDENIIKFSWNRRKKNNNNILVFCRAKTK